jgi:hypothetical protein
MCRFDSPSLLEIHPFDPLQNIDSAWRHSDLKDASRLIVEIGCGHPRQRRTECSKSCTPFPRCQNWLR